ncbi:DUF3558 domain-containing protein [Streptomyces apocyni]|uniref:DUF3558 domain-containing protein n=1 Tax=Streptomyces apocyni TaxID=2654677 RepID=UPI0012EA3EAB|nr:DUF3558 domain-containing protein [Streptomyces apocyni]
MRPLPLLLTVRLLPVVVLATAGWAWTTGPYAPSTTPAAAPRPAPSAPAPEPATHGAPPDPCAAVSEKTIKDLVPGAEPAGKELDLTNPNRRRTCSWNALDGFDYRWLDVSYDVLASEKDARSMYRKRLIATGQGTDGLGDQASVSVDLTTEDKQQTREAVVLVRSGNALVTVTHNGSNFASEGAPGADVIREGAVRVARGAVRGLEGQTAAAE